MRFCLRDTFAGRTVLAMAEPKRGRPTSPEAKRHPVMVRMDDAEKAGLDRLVDSRNAELKAEHITLKGPDVIRWLIARELTVRGLDAAPLSPSFPNGKASPPPPKPTPSKPRRAAGARR